jgi:hypothetical protein
MTSRRIAGHDQVRRVVAAAALIVCCLAAVVACGSVAPSSASPSGPPVPASGSPAGPVSGSPEGSARPRATAWPGNAVLGIEALGAADSQITAAIADLGRGIAEEDLALMRRAADGLAGVDVLMPNMDKISIFPPMVPFAQKYETAITQVSAAARALRAAIDAGDASTITSATQDLLASLELYTDVQPELGRWVHESIEQRRLLLN